MTIRLTAIILVLVSLVACQDLLTNSPSERQSSFFDTASPLSVDSLEKGYYADLDAAQQVVLRSQEELDAFWKALDSTAARPPAIDFDHVTVLATAMGKRPSSGYAVEIVAAGAKDGTVKAKVVETVPGENCGVLGVITSPYHVVKLNAIVSEVEFVVNEQVHECT